MVWEETFLTKQLKQQILLSVKERILKGENEHLELMFWVNIIKGKVNTVIIVINFFTPFPLVFMSSGWSLKLPHFSFPLEGQRFFCFYLELFPNSVENTLSC